MPTDELAVARELFFYWLRETHGRAYPLPGDEPGLTIVTDSAYPLALEARSLPGSDNPSWARRRDEIASLIADDMPARVALWVPAGADLPREEPALSEFVALVRQAAIKLGPHERSYVPLPATLYLRKAQEEGGVVSVTGGLNPFWARFTDRVRGGYDLDSTQVHRLPESEDHLNQLLDLIVERIRTLELHKVATMETIDAWTIQRLSGSDGVYILGVSPEDTTDLGLAVRRDFRRILNDAAPGLRKAAADVRALVVLGRYARIEHEGATTALRGYDPAAYSGIDFIVLAADGIIKPLIQPAPNLLPWPSQTSTRLP
jgi:hypothetical protein